MTPQPSTGIKILFVDDEPEIREIIIFGLQEHFEFTPLEASSGNEAIKILEQNTDTFCVVSDFHMPNGDGKKVFNEILIRNWNIPFILASGNVHENGSKFDGPLYLGAVEKPDLIGPTALLVKAQLEKRLTTTSIHPDPSTNPTPSQKNAPQYRRIKPQLLLGAKTLPSDIYIGLSDQKFIKRFKKGEPFSVDDIHLLKAEAIESLFMLDTEYYEFFKSTTQLLESIRRTKKADLFLAQTMTEEGLERVRALDLSLGIDAEINDLIHQYIGLTLDTLESSPGLIPYFNKFKNSKGSYAVTHSVMIAHIACRVATLMNWKTEITYQKLCLAAFIHDITVPDEDLLNHVQNDMYLARDQFTLEQIKTYTSHPEVAARLVAGPEWKLKGVDVIIQNHHAATWVGGFPKQIDFDKLDPLVQLFIFCEEFADSYCLKPHLELQKETSAKDVIKSLNASYQKGSFNLIYTAVIEALSKPDA